MVLGIATVASAQSEPNRYNTGDFKVGDRVSADPMVIKKWQPCTVTGTRPIPGRPNKLDSVEIRCDNGLSYSAIATTDELQKLQGGPAAPSWNVTEASKVGPKGATPYGTRLPHTCGSLKGPLTPALAKEAFICRSEHVSGDMMYLVEQVNIQLGGNTPYTRVWGGFEGWDGHTPLRALRGAYVGYQCARQDADPHSRFYNYGRNCNRYDYRSGTGFCWRTTFGDWQCSLTAFANSEDKHFNVAPPR